MREKEWIGKIGMERLKLLAVVAFFLLSGILYQHGIQTGRLELGTAAEVSAIDLPQEEGIPAKELLGKLDLNTAGAEELIRLPGIGEKRAADIIAYREEKGGFSAIEEIMEVSGIGEKTFAKIKEEITVGE